jgi:hypothetical protein
MPYGMTGSNYAAGDYYRGDYYQGDPGFLGTLGKAVGGFAKGLITGGPLGAVAGAAGAFIAPKAPGTSLATLPPPPVLQMPVQPGFGIQTPTTHIGFFGQPEKQLPMGPGPIGIPAIRGLHYNKSTYETRGGGTSRWGPSGNLQIHPKGTVLVRSRRMNVGNARALKRALRRARGFERLARSVMVVHRFKKKASRVGRKR